MTRPDDLTMHVFGLLEEHADDALREHLDRCACCAEMVERMKAEHRLFEAAFARDIPKTAERLRAAEEILARRPRARRS